MRVQGLKFNSNASENLRFLAGWLAPWPGLFFLVGWLAGCPLGLVGASWLACCVAVSLACWRKCGADGFKTGFGYAPGMRRTSKRYAPISDTEDDIQIGPARHTKSILSFSKEVEHLVKKGDITH